MFLNIQNLTDVTIDVGTNKCVGARMKRWTFVWTGARTKSLRLVGFAYLKRRCFHVIKARIYRPFIFTTSKFN